MYNHKISLCILFCTFSRYFYVVTFSFLLSFPKAGDDNLMQEVNQNLAEEVRIVGFLNDFKNSF